VYSESEYASDESLGDGIMLNGNNSVTQRMIGFFPIAENIMLLFGRCRIKKKYRKYTRVGECL
jgi:hypothetical protein